MLGLNVKSNEGLIYSFLGWSKCGNEIQTFENCQRTGTYGIKEPTQCYDQAKQLQLCYANKGMKIQPLCMPIFNDTRECLFKSDSHIINCKEQLNELTYCQNKPSEYVKFLKSSTQKQRESKSYDFVVNHSKYDFN